MTDKPNPNQVALSDRETDRSEQGLPFPSDLPLRRDLESALRQSEERYQALAKASPVGIFQNDPEGEATYINEKGLEMLGLTLEQALGTGWTRALHPDDYQRVEAEWMGAVTRGVPFKSEYRLCRTDGSMIWVQGEAARTFSNDGTVAGYIGTLTDVTERKEAELGLEEGAQRFDSLASVATVGILRADTRRLFTYMNPKWAELSGLTPKQARGTGWLRSFHPEDRRRVFAEWEQALVEDKPCMSEFRFRRPDGSTVWLLGQAAPERSHGRVIGYLGTITDITDLKLAEEALRKAHAEVESNEGKFRALLQSAPDGVLVFDSQGNISLVNAAAVDMFGYEQEILIGKSADDVLEHADSVRDGEVLGRLLEQEGAGMGFRGRRRDGQGFPVEINIRTIQFGTETIHIAMVRDLTERLKEIEARLQLAALIDASEDAIINADLDGTITGWSKGAERIFGYRESEILGHPSLELIPEEFRHQRNDVGERIRRGERVRLPESVRIRKDGRRIDVSSSFSPVRNKYGEITGVTAISRDITEQKLLERQFQEAQKMEAVGRLAGGIAHDFNNLLTIVTGYSALLREGMSSNHPSLPRVQAIGRAAERAAQLTRGLLAFGRKQSVEPRVLNLNNVLDDMDKMVRSLIGEDVELRTVLEDDLDNIEIDPAELEQVVINLATNARDAMPSGGRLTLETSNVVLKEIDQDRRTPTPPGSYVLFSVIDTGVGMDEEIQSHVFEPFFTTKERGKGTGLGLSTVYGTIRQSGGTIWVSSEPGQGTAFKVYLPAVDKPVTTIEEIPMQRIVGVDATILLVEDDLALRTLAAEILRNKGYTVIAAGGPTEAVAQLEASDPDLILTDVIMPEASGPELIDEIRQSRPDIKVLYMSGYTSDALEGRKSIKSEDMLQKPFTPSQLLQKVVDKLTTE